MDVAFEDVLKVTARQVDHASLTLMASAHQLVEVLFNAFHSLYLELKYSL